MKDDLLRNYKNQIIGHHKNEVMALLGPPDHEGVYKEGFQLLYEIGGKETSDQCPCNMLVLYDSTGVVFTMMWYDM